MDPELIKQVVQSVVLAVVAVIEIAAIWRIFVKAGQPGWASIVPIYNVVLLLRITGKPTWWVILMLVPLVNIVIAIIETVALAKVFGKGGGYAIGLIFLPFVFLPMLAWGDAQYQLSGAPASAFA